MRAFSAFFGVVVVPLTYALSRRMFGRGAGILAAVLAALSPAYEWYSWEIRMYSLTPVLAALTTYLLVRAIGASRLRPRALMGWMLVSLVAIFTHYSSVSLLLAHALFVVPALIVRTRRIRASYVAAFVLISLAIVAAVFFLPGISSSFRQILNLLLLNASQPRPEPVSLLAIIHDVLGASTFGMNAADPTGGWLEVAVAAVVVVGVVLPLSRARLGQRALMAVSIATPILFWSALSHVLENRPSFATSSSYCPRCTRCSAMSARFSQTGLSPRRVQWRLENGKGRNRHRPHRVCPWRQHIWASAHLRAVAELAG
jgi:uncharacterized membrane protein